MRAILQVDPAGAVPIWKQIEEGMRRQLAAGALAPGAPVPSVRDLARDLRVNPATVAKAYQGLVEAGWLVVRRGEGTFVQGDGGSRDRDRRRLLAEEAGRLAALGLALGLARTEAEAALAEAWTELEQKGAAR